MIARGRKTYEGLHHQDQTETLPTDFQFLNIDGDSIERVILAYLFYYIIKLSLKEEKLPTWVDTIDGMATLPVTPSDAQPKSFNYQPSYKRKRNDS